MPKMEKLRGNGGGATMQSEIKSCDFKNTIKELINCAKCEAVVCLCQDDNNEDEDEDIDTKSMDGKFTDHFYSLSIDTVRKSFTSVRKSIQKSFTSSSITNSNNNNKKREQQQQEQEEESDTESTDARFIEKWYSQRMTSMRSSFRKSISSIRDSMRKSFSSIPSVIEHPQQTTISTTTTTRQAMPSNTLHPYGAIRIAWDLSMLFIFAFRIPVQQTNSNIAALLEIMLNCAVRVVFIVDICMNFFTAYYDNDNSQFFNLVTDRRYITQRYLSRYICFDLLSVLLTYHLFNRSHIAALLVSGFARLTRVIRILETVNGWVARKKYCTQPVFEAYVGAIIWAISMVALLHESIAKDLIALKVIATIGLGLHSYIIIDSYEALWVHNRRNFNPNDHLDTEEIEDL